MRVVVISSYPRVDRLAYKARILEGLIDRDCEVRIVYSGIKPKDYLREARRRNMLSVGALLARRSSPAGTDVSEPVPRLADLAARHSVRVGYFDKLGDALPFVEDFRPDHGVNLSGAFIPSKLIDAVGGRIVGGHYGDLPRFRGRDTVRWPVLLGHPTVVSHMYLAKKYDMGDVLLKSPVEVTPGDTLETIRHACQTVSAAGHLAVVDAFAAGTLQRRPQRESDGSTFYEMGAFLKAKVLEILAAGDYRSPGGAAS